MKATKKDHEIFVLEFRFKALVDAYIDRKQQATESVLRFIDDGSPATQCIIQVAESLRELEETNGGDGERMRNRATKTAKQLLKDIIDRLQYLLKKRSGLSIKKEDGTFSELNVHEFVGFPERLREIKEARFALIRYNPLITDRHSEIVFAVSVIPVLLL